MKKTINKCISIILANLIVILVVMGVPTSAITGDCITDHFSKLNYATFLKRCTPPSEDSCPYVAMSLLLSYYDTYWNEKFVKDIYEWEKGEYKINSDKLVKTFAATEEAADWQNYIEESIPEGEDSTDYYIGYAYDNSFIFLESYLISLGIGLGYHPAPDPNLGLTVTELINVLNQYLFIEQEFLPGEVAVRVAYADTDDIAFIMREQIVLNKSPVILFGMRNATEDEISNGDNSKKGHFLVAYGVDNSGDILLHTGWNGDAYQNLSITDYEFNQAIIWLEINKANLPHTHSNNYVDSATGGTLCACQIYSGHDYHSTNHLFKEAFTSSVHYFQCHCGAMTGSSPHVFSYECTSSYKHTKKCDECDYEAKESHSYNTVLSSTSALGHYNACICGHQSSTLQEHYVSQYQQYNDFRHKTYCACGYNIGTATHTWVTSGLYASCTDCGARIDVSDKPILLGSEDDILYQGR